MKNLFFLFFFLLPSFVFAQFTATDEEVYSIAVNYAKNQQNDKNANVTFVSRPTASRPLYEVSIGNGKTLIISSEKYAMPILAEVDDDGQHPLFDNPDLPDGLQYFIDKYCSQILSAMNSGDNILHPQWEEFLNDANFAENISNRTIYGPFLTTAWGQSRPNSGGTMPAFNYYIETTNSHCEVLMEYKCPTGCVATAMAQIMKYWNYPVFRYGKRIQYDWCNMLDRLDYYNMDSVNYGIFIENPYYQIQRNSIARLMADCGEAADMDYCYMNDCQSFTWPVKARNALVDSFQYSSSAVRRLRSSYTASNWRDSLLLDIYNGRPVLYAGASLAIGGYEQGGHAFVCDGYNSDTQLFHFNWGHNGSGTWCALDAIIEGNSNYNHFERAVFHIYPSTNENYCNFDLELWMHYLLFYTPFQTTPPPYQNVPPTATRLYSVPISVPNGPGTYYFDDSLRTIPSGATSEYVAHKEVVLRPGFTAASGSNFTARIKPCAECETTREQDNPMIGERGLRGDAVHSRDAVHHVSTPDAAGLRLHPNPANTTLTVESDSPVREITIYDLTGRTMMTVNVRANDYSPLQTLNISSLPAGIYLLRAVTDNGVKTARFVKN